MKLADLIDLEAQLAQDERADREALAARDRAIAVALGPEATAAKRPRDRRRLLSRWLDALRERAPERLWPGRPVSRALRLLGVLLVLVGLLSGWGTAETVLAYDGTHPVNVLDALAVMVLAQIALLGLLLLSPLLPRALRGLPLLGAFRAGLGELYPAIVRRLRVPEERRAAWEAVWHRLRTRRSLYAGVEPWILLGLTQRFAVAFNLGALAAYFRLVTFSDLAFAWSTTLTVDPEMLHRWLTALSAPWAWFWQEAVPSRSLVELTRYARLEGRYLGATGGRAPDLALVGGWWPFLVAATITYGLVPRTLLLALTGAMRRRRLSTLPLDDAAVQPLLDRLAAPRVSTRGLGEEPGGGPAPAGQGLGPGPAGRFADCAVVVWRGGPDGEGAAVAAARRHVGCEPAAVHHADGRDPAADDAALRAVAAADAPVVVVAEAFEPPDKALQRFLARLRTEVGPRRPALVLLGEPREGTLKAPDEADLSVWSHALARLEDPYLGLAPVAAEEGAA